VALTTPANTGVAGAETQTGIFPIYSRLTSTTMTGTNPDGSKYSDPGVPWVNYFNGGDAVHGFPRASYGSPQSNGCVELPISTAESVYGMLAIGDIVDVKG
jgi:lipoprotein-anchoring transpeptidase ErfK/SrfK